MKLYVPGIGYVKKQWHRNCMFSVGCLPNNQTMLDECSLYFQQQMPGKSFYYELVTDGSSPLKHY